MLVRKPRGFSGAGKSSTKVSGRFGHVYTHFLLKHKKIKSIPGASGLSPARSSIIKENARDWATNIWEDMLS